MFHRCRHSSVHCLRFQNDTSQIDKQSCLDNATLKFKLESDFQGAQIRKCMDFEVNQTKNIFYLMVETGYTACLFYCIYIDYKNKKNIIKKVITTLCTTNYQG